MGFVQASMELEHGGISQGKNSSGWEGLAWVTAGLGDRAALDEADIPDTPSTVILGSPRLSDVDSDSCRGQDEAAHLDSNSASPGTPSQKRQKRFLSSERDASPPAAPATPAFCIREVCQRYQLHAVQPPS
jgi:hypothetical protein